MNRTEAYSSSEVFTQNSLGLFFQLHLRALNRLPSLPPARRILRPRLFGQHNDHNWNRSSWSEISSTGHLCVWSELC